MRFKMQMMSFKVLLFSMQMTSIGRGAPMISDSMPGDSTTPRDRAELLADGLVTVQEAAQFLSISRSKLYDLMDNGELVFVKLGRSRRIPRRALIGLAASGLQGGWRS